MRPVAAPDPSPDGQRGACLAAVLEVGWDETPGAAALDRWQEWLAPRGLRLVAAADTPNAGFWIAEHSDGAHAVMFGTPPGPVWQPAAAPAAPLRRGWVVQALDPAGGPAPAADPGAGHVTALFVAAAAEAPMQPRARARAVAGRGLEGDRYAAGAGTFSAYGGTGRDLTLVASEVLEAVGLDAAQARRNVVTSGIDVNALVGRRFRVGPVECAGRRWCEPCAHLERLTRPGVLRDLVHRGGLRADILVGGEIAVGDDVVALAAR
jgi:MOSC domain-containing protein YiiM